MCEAVPLRKAVESGHHDHLLRDSGVAVLFDQAGHAAVLRVLAPHQRRNDGVVRTALFLVPGALAGTDPFDDRRLCTAGSESSGSRTGAADHRHDRRRTRTRIRPAHQSHHHRLCGRSLRPGGTKRDGSRGARSMNLNLKDKVVVVTGGAAGIGRATVEAFQREGAQVVAWDIPAVDVTKGDVVNAATNDVIAEHGRIDVLVNNAGIVRDSQLIKWKDGEVASVMDDATFDAVINVNLKGVFLCTRAVAPHMIRNGSGVVLNASSIVGLYGNFGQTNYAATKAGVISFTKTWARELGRYNIRVNCVAPGFIVTEMVKAMPQKVLDSMAAKTPLGKMGEPADIANAYVWLASDAAKFVHGAVLSVDGGLVMGT